MVGVGDSGLRALHSGVENEGQGLGGVSLGFEFLDSEIFIPEFPTAKYYPCFIFLNFYFTFHAFRSYFFTSLAFPEPTSINFLQSRKILGLIMNQRATIPPTSYRPYQNKQIKILSQK